MSKTTLEKPTSISKLLGKPAILPGESAAFYQASLQALVQKLQATTVLQVYLAEKIHECLWWVRRYEAQKRATIVAEMAAIAKGNGGSMVSAGQAHLRDLLASNQTDASLQLALEAVRHTPESLQQKAWANRAKSLQQFDQQIALQTKILAGLQASYEFAFNRQAHAERLQLQNSVLRRDLQSLDLPPAEAAPPPSNPQQGT